MFSKLLRRGATALGGATIGLLLLSGGALAWTGHVSGESPANLAGSSDGYYVWRDVSGVHVRTTDTTGSYFYSGIIHTDGTLHAVQGYRMEPGDEVTRIDDHNLRFRFVTHQGVDGVDFWVGSGSTLVFDLRQNGQEISTSEIYLGANGIHPDSAPFRIWRGD
ncbi:MAG TPA: hypothetical protein VFZ25_10280 [Chloroflexota bacterium]|nr:hypothetical protein [Chloroflexota bacterium]